MAWSAGPLLARCCQWIRLSERSSQRAFQISTEVRADDALGRRKVLARVADQGEQSHELVRVGVRFPAVRETANNLEISRLVVAIAVDAVE